MEDSGQKNRQTKKREYTPVGLGVVALGAPGLRAIVALEVRGGERVGTPV